MEHCWRVFTFIIRKKYLRLKWRKYYHVQVLFVSEYVLAGNHLIVFTITNVVDLVH
jgi:hypothetical protein